MRFVMRAHLNAPATVARQCGCAPGSAEHARARRCGARQRRTVRSEHRSPWRHQIHRLHSTSKNDHDLQREKEAPGGRDSQHHASAISSPHQSVRARAISARAGAPVARGDRLSSRVMCACRSSPCGPAQGVSSRSQISARRTHHGSRGQARLAGRLSAGRRWCDARVARPAQSNPGGAGRGVSERASRDSGPSMALPRQAASPRLQ